MESSLSKLDRDIARSFLNLPSYIPIQMRQKDDLIPQSHPNPLYYDVIIDTVTDYDIFYPIAKQTQKYYYESDENSINPCYQVQRLDELAVSIDFPHDYETTSNNSNQIQAIQYERKNVRFNDNPTLIPYSSKSIETPSIPIDQYYFHPEAISQPTVRYIHTPFFWFRPVLNHNYAICIPTTRPSLHAYITPLYNPMNSTPNPIRL